MYNKLSVLVAGFLVLLTLALLMGEHFKKKSELNENQQDKIQAVIQQKEIEADKILTSLLARLQNTDCVPFLLEEIPGRAGNHGIEILAFRDDSLIYWTENEVLYQPKSKDFCYKNEFLHLSNGYYEKRVLHEKDICLIALILVKADYPYQNKYFKNVFQRDFGPCTHAEISMEGGDYNIYSIDGDFLFALYQKSTGTQLSSQYLIPLFVIYLLCFLLLMAIIVVAYQRLSRYIRNKYVRLLFLVLDMIIIRLVLYYFKIPAILYDSYLFDPVYTSFSSLYMSLGDTLINIILILIIVSQCYQKTQIRHFKILSTTKGYLVGLLCFGAAFGLFYINEMLIGDFVKEVTFEIELTNIFNIEFISLVGLVIVTTAYIIVLLIADRLVNVVCKTSHCPTGISALVSISLVILALLFSILHSVYIFLAFYLTIIIGLMVLRYQGFKLISPGNLLVFVLLLASLTTYTLYVNNNIKSAENQRSFVGRILEKGNAGIEEKFCQLKVKIENNTKLDTLLLRFLNNEDVEDTITQQIRQYFNNENWSQYDIMITLCQPQKVLHILPEDYLTDCNDYFMNKIRELGVGASCNDLYYLDQYSLDKDYLGIANMKSENGNGFNVYIELFSKFVPEGLGYPELLISGGSEINEYLKKYSYAKYINKQFVYKFGNYLYGFQLDNYKINDTIPDHFKLDGYDHYYYSLGKGKDLLVSEKSTGFFSFIAPFSFLLILYSVYFIILYFIVDNESKKYADKTLRKRLQYSVIGIIFVSFVIIGSLSILYIIRLNDNKVDSILREKSHSVLIELEHKLADYESITPEMYDYVHELLNKFSQVFFSDINLYGLDGSLIATSRSNIFDEGIISTKMDEKAYKSLKIDKKLLYIQKEEIGNYAYLSAYLPFRNANNKIVAYLNLPYFAKQDELRTELSTFITAFINVFIIIFASAIVITVLVSRYITKPLKIIRAKIGSLQFGKANEKIEWERKDEIGGLVEEYNRMLDELVRSAEMLAQTERESAWREMAKQVAHEIKNPLTPMKLSVQHLIRSKKDGSRDWDAQFQRIASTLIEQIDSLSAIASDFSDFAKMPDSKGEDVELAGVIRSASDLYKNIDNISFEFEFAPDKNYYVHIDRRQLIRVFNNLFENAIQALDNRKQGVIRISIITVAQYYEISVEDNGPGINPDISHKIFSPSFTTKTSGMGLGLAIVKSIILDAGGEISFESRTGKGARFLISLPVV